MLRARNGDKDAFCEIVNVYQASVRAYIARFVHDSEQVLDLAQDAFLIAYRRLDKFDASLEFYPWLRGIARTHALEYLRKTGRRRRREEAAAMDDSIALWNAERMERDDSSLDHAQELKRCMGHLAETSAQVLNLRYFQQLSIRDVAAALNRTEGTVKMLLLRVRQSLRKCIETNSRVEALPE